jgi:acetyltransferase-like isoleucine patch superfamily enzyme
MTEQTQYPPGSWSEGEVPVNVRLGVGTLITGGNAFRRFHSRLEPGLIIGEHCTMDGVHFAQGWDARIVVGDYCYFTNALLLCELEIIIGSYVLMGWNATIADTDFHPVAPAERIADAIACSALGRGRPRPEIPRRPVVIEDDVWIGPNATILKGVRVGTGALVEAGALVTHDVPPRSRVVGNPAKAMEEL